MASVVPEFKPGQIVQCIDKGLFDTLTVGKFYEVVKVSENVLLLRNDKGEMSWELVQFFANRARLKGQKKHLRLFSFESE